jgi:metal-responsive CopG/Arc/MetJ family transcriptional regulator
MNSMKSKVVRVTVSLPAPLLEAADAKLVEEDESRSSMMRRLIEAALRAAEEEEDVARWIRAYQEHPQTEEELGWLDEVALESLANLPWE